MYNNNNHHNNNDNNNNVATSSPSRVVSSRLELGRVPRPEAKFLLESLALNHSAASKWSSSEGFQENPLAVQHKSWEIC